MLRKRIKKKPKLNTFMLHSKSTYFYKQRWFTYLVPSAAGLALLMVMLSAINPLVSAPDEALALVDDDLLNPSLSLSFNSGNEISEMANAKAGEVAYITNNVKVSAVKVDGYQVFVQAASGISNSLSGQIPTNTLKITGVGTNVAPASFGENKWGYALQEGSDLAPSSLTYSTVPASDNVTPAYDTSADTETKDFTLAFAAKFGSDAGADHYKTNVLLSVAAGAKEVAGFNELFLGFDSITYMQDMTSSICAAAKVNETKQLIDRRDNKKYWVTKLQDQNCWMSQNLDLDLTTAGLTTQYTDITSNWTSGVTATQKNTITYGTFSSDGNVIASFDPGEYIYITPAEQHTCSSAASLAQCTSYGWKTTTGLTATTDPNFTTKSEGNAIGGNYYDSHFLAGNYYTYAAATAGTGTNLTTAIAASGSICPKNWKLPIGGSNNNIIKGSYYYLLQEYGVQSKPVSIDTIQQYDIRLSPLFFVYGGYAYSGVLQKAGGNGIYRTATAAESAYYANSMEFSTTVSYPTGTAGSGYGNAMRYQGQSIRCVAR